MGHKKRFEKIEVETEVQSTRKDKDKVQETSKGKEKKSFLQKIGLKRKLEIAGEKREERPKEPPPSRSTQPPQQPQPQLKPLPEPILELEKGQQKNPLAVLDEIEKAEQKALKAEKERPLSPRTIQKKAIADKWEKIRATREKIQKAESNIWTAVLFLILGGTVLFLAITNPAIRGMGGDFISLLFVVLSIFFGRKRRW